MWSGSGLGIVRSLKRSLWLLNGSMLTSPVSRDCRSGLHGIAGINRDDVTTKNGTVPGTLGTALLALHLYCRLVLLLRTLYCCLLCCEVWSGVNCEQFMTYVHTIIIGVYIAYLYSRVQSTGTPSTVFSLVQTPDYCATCSFLTSNTY